MKKYFMLTFILFTLIIYFFYNSKETILITKDNINLFFNVLLPTLFPYMILVLLFVNYKCHLIIAYLIQYISIPLFKISGKSFSIVLLGILGGYPLISLLGKEIINEDNKKELNKLIPLFSFPSLSFLLNIINVNSKINFLLFYLLSSFIILFMFKDNKQIKYISLHDISKEFTTNNNYISIFSKTLFKSLSTLSLIFSNLLFFSLFKTLFKFNNEKINNIFLGLFEFSRSSIYLSNNINSSLDIIILGSLLLFGGLNILMQIYIIYNDSHLLNFRVFIKYRMLLVIIYALLIFLFI